MANRSVKRLEKSNTFVIGIPYIDNRGMRMKITADNYDNVKAAMKKFLMDEIEKHSKEVGGKHKLSLKIGKSYTHVEMVTKRGAFSALERLYKEIKEKELTESKELK